MNIDGGKKAVLLLIWADGQFHLCNGNHCFLSWLTVKLSNPEVNLLPKAEFDFFLVGGGGWLQLYFYSSSFPRYQHLYINLELLRCGTLFVE